MLLQEFIMQNNNYRSFQQINMSDEGSSFESGMLDKLSTSFSQSANVREDRSPCVQRRSRSLQVAAHSREKTTDGINSQLGSLNLDGMNMFTSTPTTRTGTTCYENPANVSNTKKMSCTPAKLFNPQDAPPAPPTLHRSSSAGCIQMPNPVISRSVFTGRGSILTEVIDEKVENISDVSMASCGSRDKSMPSQLAVYDEIAKDELDLQTTDMPNTAVVSAKSRNVSCRAQICVYLLVAVSVCAAVMAVLVGSSRCARPDSHTFASIEKQLRDQVIGQHLAVELLPPVLDHFFSYGNKRKTLIFSFHGWTGVGKNLVAGIVSSSIVPTSAVTKIFIPTDFPGIVAESEKRQAMKIQDLIMNYSGTCPVRVIIIDEVDKGDEQTLAGLWDGLRKLNTHNNTVDKTVVFLLTNAGGHEINQYVYKHLLDGNTRQTLNLASVQEVLVKSSNPALKALQGDLTPDYVVPYLPLERRHVIHCVRVFLQAAGETMTDGEISSFVDSFPYFQVSNGPSFSKSGCKKVSSKLHLHFDK